MYDWTHLYLAGGPLDVEFGFCMVHLHSGRAPTTYAVLGKYVQQPTFPKNVPQHLDALLDQASAKSNLKGQTFQSTASQLFVTGSSNRQLF